MACTWRMRTQTAMRSASVLLLALAIGGVGFAASAQEAASIVGVTARGGFGLSGETDAPVGFGFEVELHPTKAIVPSVRLDGWMYGIACTAFPAACPSSVTTLTLGGTYHVRSATRLIPYVGVDIGGMRWASGTSGLTLRLRGGADIRLIRHVMLNLDGGAARFVAVSRTEGGQLHNHLVNLSIGLKLWG